MTAPANSKIGIKIKMIYSKPKGSSPTAKVIKKYGNGLVVKEQNQDKLNCFLIITEISHISICFYFSIFELEVTKN